MKRALVYHRTLATIGGGKFVLMKIIETMKDKGFSVTLATHDNFNEMPRLWQKITKTFDEEIKPDDFCAIPKVANHIAVSKFSFLKKALHLAEIVRRNRFIESVGKFYDIIVDVYGDLTFPSNLSYIHDPPPNIRIELLPPHYLSYRLLYRSLALRANKRRLFIVTNSRYTSEKIYKNTKFSSKIINPPVSIGKYFDVFEREERFDFIITISRIEHKKNLLIIPEIIKNVENAIFILIGIKTNETSSILKLLLRKAYKLNVADRLKVLVDASFAKKKGWLSKGKIYFHTMPNESFGISVVEGMASGLVPVVPKGGGAWTDILCQQNGVYGFAYRNIEEAIYYLNKLLKDDEARRRIKKNMKNYVWHFDERLFISHISKLIDIIESRK